MEELRKIMTDKMLEAMRKNIRNTAIYVRSKIDEGNFPFIGIVNERYVANSNIVSDSNGVIKVNHDYIIPNDYFTIKTIISMAMSDMDNIEDREVIILDGAARYLEIYYERLMIMPCIRSHNNVESILGVIKSMLDTDYYLFSDSLHCLFSSSSLIHDVGTTLDETCDKIREKYVFNHESLRGRYMKHLKYIAKLMLFKNASFIGVIPSSLRDYLPDYSFVEIVPLDNRDSYGKMPQYVVKVNNGEMHKTFMQKGKDDNITPNDLFLVEYLEDYYLHSLRLGYSPLSIPDDSEYIDVAVSMKLCIKSSAYDELKRIENHAESLLDLDNWTEIENVRDVHVERIEGSSELSFNTKYFDKASELAMRAMLTPFSLKSSTEKIEDVDQTIEPDIPAKSTGANFYDILDEDNK